MSDRYLMLSGLAYIIFGSVLVFALLRWMLDTSSANPWPWIINVCAFMLMATWAHGRRTR